MAHQQSDLESSVLDTSNPKADNPVPQKGPARPDIGARADTFLAQRRRYVVGAIVAVSALVRLTYFAQLSDDACLYQHLWADSDMNFNDAWAKEIGAGDPLVDKPFHPLHDWYKNLARIYLSAHPEKSRDLLGSWRGPGPAPPVEKLLWDEWYGGKAFYHEPLYAYVLALTYTFFGDDVRPMLILQLLAGVVGNVLIYLVGRRYFGDLAGVIAAAMATLCGPLLYYEMVLLRESLLVVAGLAILFLTQRALDSSTWPRWLGAGAAFGVALLLKTSLALLLPLALAALVWMHRKEPRRLAARVGALIGGTALLLAPAVGRNIAVGAPPLNLSSVGAITFVNANAADYGRDEDFLGFNVSYQYAADIMGASGGEFLPAALATLRTHDGVGSYLRQLWVKTTAIMWWYEAPNNTNFYYYRLHASVLRCLPVTFLLIGPLSLAGMALAAPRIRQLWLLYATVLTTILVLLGFGVYSRLRLPLAPPLILFAALSIVSIIRWASSRNLAKLSCLALALIVLALWMGKPLSASQPLIPYLDYAVPFRTYYDPRIAEASARRDPATAATLLADALRYEPEELRSLDAAHPITTIDQLKVAMLFVETRIRYMIELQSWSLRERDAKKREHCAQETSRQRQQLAQFNAVILNYPKDLQRAPALAEAYYNLGVAFAGCGQVEMAIAYYQKALEFKPDLAQAHINLGDVLAGRGQFDEAIDHCGKALEITPNSAEAHRIDGLALASVGRFDEAIDHYRKSLEFQPDDPIVRNNLGAALADRGEVDEAIRHYQRAIELKPDYAPAHYNLGLQLANRGRTAEALEHYQTALGLALARNDGALADEIQAQMRRIRPD